MAQIKMVQIEMEIGFALFILGLVAGFIAGVCYALPFLGGI